MVPLEGIDIDSLVVGQTRDPKSKLQFSLYKSNCVAPLILAPRYVTLRVYLLHTHFICLRNPPSKTVDEDSTVVNVQQFH